MCNLEGGPLHRLHYPCPKIAYSFEFTFCDRRGALPTAKIFSGLGPDYKNQSMDPDDAEIKPRPVKPGQVPRPILRDCLWARDLHKNFTFSFQAQNL